MKKYYCSIVLILFLGALSFCFLKNSDKNSSPTTWNTFEDVPNGWEIQYPTDITSVELADDIGPKNWLSNIIFRKDEQRIFSIWVDATTTRPTDGFITIDNFIPNGKSFVFVKENKAFYIHMHPNAPVEKILESLVVEE